MFLVRHWSYFHDADPTHGKTKYVSHAQAVQEGLAYVQNGQAILAADSNNDLPYGAKRHSYVVGRVMVATDRFLTWV